MSQPILPVALIDCVVVRSMELTEAVPVAIVYFSLVSGAVDPTILPISFQFIVFEGAFVDDSIGPGEYSLSVQHSHAEFPVVCVSVFVFDFPLAMQRPPVDFPRFVKDVPIRVLLFQQDFRLLQRDHKSQPRL